MKNYILILFAGMLCMCCESNVVFQEKTDFEDNKWHIDSTVSFSFKIEDTAAAYNVYYLIRNTINYPYNNLYVTYYLKDSSRSQITKELHEMQLIHPKTGKPYGDGIGDIFDHEILALQNLKFPYKGKYYFDIDQYMRKNPLPEIMAVGVKVKKVE